MKQSLCILAAALSFLSIALGENQQLRRLLLLADDPKTIETKTNKVTNTAKSCQVKEDVPKRSQNYEDDIIYNTFFAGPSPKCGGTVVEMGGLNGKTFSNSWFFEFALDWKSILVEADPENFEKMERNRPNAINLFGAMCLGESVAFQSGIKLATGGLVSDMSERHKERWVDGKKPIVQVPCMQVTKVLKEHQIEHVDVFFLDVEGGELTVLQTIDFNEAPVIDMFVVEMDRTNPQKDEAVRVLLRSNGYMSPFKINDLCRQKKPHCQINELFVLETVWNERKQSS